MPLISPIDYQNLFEALRKKVPRLKDSGKVASYIPELARVDPGKFGIHLLTLDKKKFGFGDHQEKFSIQSIAKVLALTLAFKLENEKLWTRVGVEPSGNPFNSLVQLEYENGVPRNPLINAGALVVCDVLISRLKNPKQEFIEFVRDLSGMPDLNYCKRIAESEKSTGFRNAALVNLMKACGNIHSEVETVLDLYFNLCSIEMSCEELCWTFLYLAANGRHPTSSKQIISVSKSKRINAVMQLCGFYDEAGEFSFKVGLPGKSGVGGGIVAVNPGHYAIAVWSPKLNSCGNSFKGMKILEFITTYTQSSIF